MQIRKLQISGQPKIVIEMIGGKLRLRAGEPGQVEARYPDGAELTLAESEDEVHLSCNAECHLVVPAEARIEAETIGGDLTASNLNGALMVKTVGGSLRMRRTGGVAAQTIGGGLSVRQLSGGLSADNIGGDALVDQVEGDVRLQAVGGDVRISRVSGVIDVSAGGDCKLSLEPAGDKASSVTAGGDLSCTVPEDASGYFKLQVGGDCRLAVPVQAVDTPGGCEVRLGEAVPDVNLSAGGDLTLRAGSADSEVAAADIGDAIAIRVGAEIETHMAQIEDRLSGLGDRLQSFDSDRIGRKIRSSIAKAQRRAAKAQRRAASMRDFKVELPSAGTGGEPSDEERLMILRMLEQGKINVDEAETLLEALEA